MDLHASAAPVAPVVLRGRRVVLEPLEPRHADELLAAVAPDDDVWEHMTSEPRTRSEMLAWVEARRAPRAGLASLAFLQRDRAGGAAMGSTALFDIDPMARSAEVGFTWLAAPYRGTGANAEAKRLLMGHAFDTLGLVRVQLVTDVRNARSQRAMQRLGFVREGVLRNFRRRKDGTPRDSVVFSVVDREWPDVRERLDALLAA